MHKYFEINEQGHNIRCKAYLNEKGAPEKAVIFCTGFAGHKDNKAAENFAEKLLSKHKNMIVVVFDWPAHGDDVKKKLDLADCDAYLRLVMRGVKDKYGVTDLYCYTTSFGAYIVLKYISEHGNPFRKIALRCPAVDMYDVLTRTVIQNDAFDKLIAGRDAQIGFDRKVTVTRHLLDALQANDIRRRDYLDYADDLLILQGTADELVPFESAKSFAEDNVIEFIPVEGADHRFQNPLHMALATKYVMLFFDA